MVSSIFKDKEISNWFNIYLPKIIKKWNQKGGAKGKFLKDKWSLFKSDNAKWMKVQVKEGLSEAKIYSVCIHNRIITFLIYLTFLGF